MGATELCVSVTAVPEKGKANAALLRLLAKRLGRPVRDLELAAGATDRHKQVLLRGEAAALERELTAWLAKEEQARPNDRTKTR